MPGEYCASSETLYVSKKGKAHNRQRKAERRQSDALFDLALSARLVGDLFGSESQCLQAAALMIVTARELGYEVEPRLVSAAGVARHDGQVTGFVSGSVAAAAAAEIGLPAPEVEENAHFAQDWAGHVVVILRDPPLLLDPNFRQFSRAGFPEVSIAMKVNDVVPTAGFWQATLDRDCVVRYFPDDRNAATHLATIHSLAGRYLALSQALARMVRSGVEPEDATWVDVLAASQPALF